MVRRRGGTAARGYGTKHQQERQAWKAKVAGGEVHCARCGGLIDPGSDWHLDHNDKDRGRYNGPAHAACNVIAANKRRAHRTQDRRSRDW